MAVKPNIEAAATCKVHFNPSRGKNMREVTQVTPESAKTAAAVEEA